MTPNESSAGTNACEFYLATVTEVTNAGVRIQLDGDIAPMEKRYRRIYTVRVGNRALVIKMNGTYIVIGPLYQTS